MFYAYLNLTIPNLKYIQRVKCAYKFLTDTKIIMHSQAEQTKNSKKNVILSSKCKMCFSVVFIKRISLGIYSTKQFFFIYSPFLTLYIFLTLENFFFKRIQLFFNVIKNNIIQYRCQIKLYARHFWLIRIQKRIS